MNLLNLPDEILIIIINLLDVKSLYNLYTASDHIRNLICNYGVIKTCNLSLSIMARVDTLKSLFFKDVSVNLKELIVCGVNDLYKTRLLPALKRLKCLNKLDVTFTNITVVDVIDIHSVCPTITDISVNFLCNLKSEQLPKLKEVFKNYLYVHFVSDPFIICRRLQFYILLNAKLKKLKCTIIDSKNDCHFIILQRYIKSFDSCNIHYSPNMIFDMTAPILNCESGERNEVLDISDYEVLLMLFPSEGLNKSVCCATAKFDAFFNKQCNSYDYETLNNMIQFNSQFTIIPEKYETYYPISLKLWNKSSVKFDNRFFSVLQSQLKYELPCYFDSSSNSPVSSEPDLYITMPHGGEHKLECQQMGLKKKRIGTPSCILDYDSAFQEHSQIQLMLSFQSDQNIRSASIAESYDYLKKLTYLCLSGQVILSFEFFDMLFRCSVNLATLRVDTQSAGSYSKAIARSLPVSQSIKNLHLTDRNIHFPTLYTSMSQCKTLENVHIMDKEFSSNFIDASAVFAKCVNLYCMYLYIQSSISDKKKFMLTFKNADKKQIDLKLLCNSTYVYSPCSDVFRLDLLNK